jgi:cytochrome c553
MSGPSVFSRHDRWVTPTIALALGLFLAAAVAGFILLPYAQGDLQFGDLWNAICRAAGVPVSQDARSIIKPDFKVSSVVMTEAHAAPDPDSIGRGATIAQQCAICHGPTGVSRADSPNLAGQYASVIYKQLVDFRSGARSNAIMTPFAVRLRDRDIEDLSAYYAYLPRLPAYHAPPAAGAPRIVVFGAPMRGIAPCGSCHGSLDNKVGSPWLEGQSTVYMKAQLAAFASGGRRNDISQQMRNVARGMTPDEITQAADYYASRPAETVSSFR